MSAADPDLDARLTLRLGDTAAAALEGIVAAARYVAPERRACASAAAALRRTPSRDAEQVDQLLFGEAFDVLADDGDWSFGQAVRDGYVGWTRSQALRAATAPTHAVAALRTYAFAEPSIKTAPVHRLSMNALVAVEAREGRFAKLGGSGWGVESHLTPLGAFAEDITATALRFLHAPYLWGGRDSLGLDCSGLVQQALYAAGRGCPRDTDQQARLGRAVEREALGRGDLVFWPGHVGVMLDADRLVHANAHHMRVAIEPLNETLARYAQAGVGPPTAFRRP